MCGKIFVRLSSPEEIQANTYILNKSMTLTEIFDAMNTGNPKYISQSKFTVIEGATIPQAAEAIAKESGLSEEEILEKWSDRDYLNKLIDQYWFCLLYTSSGWILMDYGDIIVNLLTVEMREKYNIEKVWGDCEFLNLED